ncbi:hypothetical protein H6G64_28705 [Calothrix sp. FACHB-156]|nr:hypothetical protein [Calothrix sp. FACHB-156]
MGTSIFTQNSELSTQHSALSTQHSALNTQHSTLSTQHSALSTQGYAIAYNTLSSIKITEIFFLFPVPFLRKQLPAPN